jgi:hypothetical protein
LGGVAFTDFSDFVFSKNNGLLFILFNGSFLQFETYNDFVFFRFSSSIVFFLYSVRDFFLCLSFI